MRWLKFGVTLPVSAYASSTYSNQLVDFIGSHINPYFPFSTHGTQNVSDQNLWDWGLHVLSDPEHVLSFGLITAGTAYVISRLWDGTARQFEERNPVNTYKKTA